MAQRGFFASVSVSIGPRLLIDRVRVRLRNDCRLEGGRGLCDWGCYGEGVRLGDGEHGCNGDVEG